MDAPTIAELLQAPVVLNALEEAWQARQEWVRSQLRQPSDRTG